MTPVSFNTFSATPISGNAGTKVYSMVVFTLIVVAVIAAFIWMTRDKKEGKEFKAVKPFDNANNDVSELPFI